MIQLAPNQAEEEKFFCDRTDTFDIGLTLTKNRLMISLKDFVDWAIYEEEYSEENIGKEINRKMDLIDIFSAFSQEKPQSDQNSMPAEENENILFDHYEFGSIVEHEGSPCYKIEKQGKITVYLMLMDIKNKKQFLCQSQLKLKKIRCMNEMEICTEKFMIQKNDILRSFSEKAEKERLENLKNFRRFLETNNKKNQLENRKKILRSLPQPYAKNFHIEGTKVQYIGGTNGWVQYIFNHPIYENQNSKFKIKIIKAQNKQILIGIVDFVKQIGKKKSLGSNNQICFGANNDHKFFSSSQPPNLVYDEFKEGDIIQIFVSRVKEQIQYIVNGQTKYQLGCQILGDSARIFMPYTEMCNKNDAVQWVMEDQDQEKEKQRQKQEQKQKMKMPKKEKEKEKEEAEAEAE